jgi:hypothetical protein
MTILTLNKAAVSAFGTAAKIRVKNVDGTLFVRPTARKAGVNLPKGEKLVSLNRAGAKTSAEVIGFEAPEGNFGLVAAKYGWMVLANATPSKTEAAIRVG